MENSLSVPPKGYLFFPTSQQQKTKPGKDGIRYFYYGQIQHDEYEKRKLKEYYQYVKKQKLKNYEDQYWTFQKILLILGGNGYKFQKTYKAIQNHDKWRKQNLPSTLTPKLQQIYNKGFLYLSGRDYQFRPIFVMNAKLIEYNIVQEYKNAVIHVHQAVIQHMLLPGQIQNWIVIYDLGNMGVTEIPVGAVKNVMKTISNNYGGRLFRLYIVNAPSTVSFIWKMASAVLDDVTVDKIKIKNDGNIPQIFSYCDKSQVEVKYGGTQADRTQFWPLSIPQPVIKEQLLISEQKYQKYLNDGYLKNNKVSPYIKKTQ